MKKIRYRLKQGCGSHTMRGNVYVAGDIIETNADELRGVLDKFEQLEPTPSQSELTVGLRIEQCEGGFNLVNSVTDEKINDEPLHQDVAEVMAMKTIDEVITELEIAKDSMPDGKA